MLARSGALGFIVENIDLRDFSKVWLGDRVRMTFFDGEHGGGIVVDL